MLFDLTYSRKDIVRTVAIGFTLGSLILSIGIFVIIIGMAIFDVEPFSLRRAVINALWVPIVLLAVGIAIGWVVRIGLGLHAWWRYRKNPPRMDLEKTVAGLKRSD